MSLLRNKTLLGHCNKDVLYVCIIDHFSLSNKPANEILVVTVYANSECLDDGVQMHTLTRLFVSRTHKYETFT